MHDKGRSWDHIFEVTGTAEEWDQAFEATKEKCPDAEKMTIDGKQIIVCNDSEGAFVGRLSASSKAHKVKLVRDTD